MPPIIAVSLFKRRDFKTLAPFNAYLFVYAPYPEELFPNQVRHPCFMDATENKFLIIVPLLQLSFLSPL